MIVAMVNEFVDWLIAEMDRRGWNNSDLARAADVVPSTVSMIISGQKKPGWEFSKGVARALGLPPDFVFSKAGLLPPMPPTPLADVPRLQTFLDKLARLDREAQNRIMDTALMLLEIDEAAREESPAQTDLLR
jgi:transcriptional regulator with XRE-family HTH domain